MTRPLLRRLGPARRGAVIGAFCGLISWGIAQQPFVRGLEEWLQDAHFVDRGTRASATKVVLVGLDDATLGTLPRPLTAISPELGQVVTYLHDRGAAAIGLDLMIPETLDAYDQAHGLDGKALGLAAGRAGNVVLPLMLGDAGRPIGPLRTWQTGSPLALVELSADADHIVRRQQLAGRVGDVAFDQFALALLNVAVLAGTDREGVLYVDHHAVPLDERGQLRINFVGPPGTIPHLSFARVLDASRKGGPLPLDQQGRPADLDGAIVIVGVTAHSLGDYHATPYANGTLLTAWSHRPRLMSGPELQANIVATLADGAFITTPWWLSSLPLVLALGAALGWSFARLSLAQGFVLAFAHHWLWKGLGLATFWLGYWRVEMAAMLLTGLIAYGAIFALRWRRLRARLGGVVKGKVLARLLEDEADYPGLIGDEREVTLLFADIRGFTRYSNRHTPREVVTLLNTYFEAVVPILERHGATLDKYIGDGIMTFFGAPDPQPDHAERAVRAAVAMVARVHDLKATWTKLDAPDFRIGVGVHTGSPLIGMIGGAQQLDYTAIGDAVNIAARIESANKSQDSEILISTRAYNLLDDALRRELGCAAEPVHVEASGIAEGLMVYRVGGPAGLGPGAR
jgi:adenylate cyclase